MISRNHIRLELLDEGLLVLDVSTNGTVIRTRTGPYSSAEEIHLSGGPPYLLKPWDSVELHPGVLLSRADRGMHRSAGNLGSVMGDAPTIAMRPPL
jgi:hypothetical protein